jgi:hypothetical protein
LSTIGDPASGQCGDVGWLPYLVVNGRVPAIKLTEEELIWLSALVGRPSAGCRNGGAVQLKNLWRTVWATPSLVASF